VEVKAFGRHETFRGKTTRNTQLRWEVGSHGRRTAGATHSKIAQTCVGDAGVWEKEENAKKTEFPEKQKNQ